ncbi:hypothetical protein CesoFtcFv8_007986 [Champsocephalus esox]|uniref:Uncharacterized protein n=2 Tax=Champsocephalus TaxID=52236 RepID=A0AAN8E1M5_CHAGU|nr:hypothetical protein CesoFtcFv8_007986 [Champsocephalus esox]KAK5928513.1 hypothetical protein CgunFtcFv8_013570 [Champsocephalus gunnari]
MQVREEGSGPRAAIILSQQELTPSPLWLRVRPPRSAASYLMMPPPLLGVESRRLSGGSPSILQLSGKEANHVINGNAHT